MGKGLVEIEVEQRRRKWWRNGGTSWRCHPAGKLMWPVRVGCACAGPGLCLGAGVGGGSLDSSGRTRPVVVAAAAGLVS